MPEHITVSEAGRRGAIALNEKRTPEERSEAGRRAVNIRWAKVRAQVAASRREQGLPETVSDDRVLGLLAAQVLAQGGAQ